MTKKYQKRKSPPPSVKPQTGEAGAAQTQAPSPVLASTKRAGLDQAALDQTVKHVKGDLVLSLVLGVIIFGLMIVLYFIFR